MDQLPPTIRRGEVRKQRESENRVLSNWHLAMEIRDHSFKANTLDTMSGAVDAAIGMGFDARPMAIDSGQSFFGVFRAGDSGRYASPLVILHHGPGMPEVEFYPTPEKRDG